MGQPVNVTLDDYSPVIEYSPAGAWRDGSTTDPYWDSYSNNGTFTLTTTSGASATLTFNGTAVWIYGAKRGNHGPYNITLDGNDYEDDGYYNGQIFQQVLFSSVGLDATTPHTVSIINSYTDVTEPYLDIDFIVYQMEMPDDYEEVKQQDAASNFLYSPSTWSTNPENLSTYNGGTGHSTSSRDAYVNYTFEGNFIRSQVELYGPVGPFAGLFTVQLDDNPPKTLNSTRSKFTPQTVLYQDSGLSQGTHTMMITNSPFSGQTLSIDYAVVEQSGNNTNTGGDSSPSSSSSTSSSSSNVAVIGGIAAGVFGVLVIAMILFFLWYRRRHRKPAILPQEVLQAEFDDAHEEAADSSTRLTPFVTSSISRYPEHPPPGPVPFPSTGYDSSEPGPSLYPSSYYRSVSGNSSSSARFVVQNAGGAAGGTRSVSDAVEEKRRLAAALRERDQRESRDQNFGSITLSHPGNVEYSVLPGYAM